MRGKVRGGREEVQRQGERRDLGEDALRADGGKGLLPGRLRGAALEKGKFDSISSTVFLAKCPIMFGGSEPFNMDDGR